MEEQGLVIVKDNFLSRIANTLRKFFFKGREKQLLIEARRSW